MCRLCLILSLMLTAFSTSGANAGPEFLLPNDPRGDEVRRPAIELVTRIAEGDLTGAEAEFAGPPEQAELLRAHIGFVEAMNKARQSLDARYGKGAVDPLRSGSELYRGLADRVKRDLVTLNGDDASISAGSLIVQGFDLRRVNGRWRVTHLTIHHDRVGALVAFDRAFTQLANDTRAAVEGGKFPKAEDLVAAVEPRAHSLMGSVGLETFRSATRPARPATRPARNREQAAPPARFPSGSRIQGLIGKPFRSPEVQQLVALFPGAPHVSTYETAFYVVSEPLGIELRFTLPDGLFGGCTLHAEGSDGFSQFPGELPHALSFTDVRRDVERKLGAPPSSSGIGHLPYHSWYPGLGLSIDYLWNEPRDPDNPIDLLGLSAPKVVRNAPPTQPAAPNGARVAFRLVLDRPAPAADFDLLADPNDPSGRAKIAVSRKVLLDGTAIAEVAPIYTGPQFDQPAMSLTMSDDGARRLAEITAGHPRERLAILLDGQVISAPQINGTSSKSVLIELNREQKGGANEDVPGRLHAAVNALPAETVPATRPSR